MGGKFSRARPTATARAVKDCREGFEVETENVKKKPNVLKHVTSRRRREVSDDYRVMKRKLGQGAHGTVRLAQKKHGKKEMVALKSVVKKGYRTVQLLRREISILTSLQDPGIAKLLDVYETETSVHMVLELCQLELFDYVVDSECLEETETKDFVRQILNIVSRLHDNGIVHRDLKTENVMIGQNGKLKIIDFGLSNHYMEGDKNQLRSKVGTALYVAPEIMQRMPYTNKCDLWSVGVMTYFMICGYPPFMGESDAEIIKQSISGNVPFPEEEWDYVSEEAKDFILSLLAVNPDHRISASQALNSPWLKQKSDKKQIATDTLNIPQPKPQDEYY